MGRKWESNGVMGQRDGRLETEGFWMETGMVGFGMESEGLERWNWTDIGRCQEEELNGLR
jgi:hypothetical protein